MSAATLSSEKLLISACLMGKAVRYDGRPKADAHPFLTALAERGQLIEACPECEAGALIPRSPAEIEPGHTADDVLDGRARVLETDGRDVTALFLEGAHLILDRAISNGCRIALLTDKSPSCASSLVYDGTFSGKTNPGMGVTTALLRRNGIEVFADHQIDALRAAMGEAGLKPLP